MKKLLILRQRIIISLKISNVMNKKTLKVGDKIFYEKDGEFYQDIVTEVLTTDEGSLYSLKDYDWWVVTDNEILDESDKRVQRVLCKSKDKMVSLSEVRSWLRSHARNYYESDSWSSFKDEDMIDDLCITMLYK